ncbi:hypothetical protein M9H77_34778 [Catharanthus roseus]|uniref:Uncharacterized protein n=1 Tax=Catharanthus roseus TaxID=4058 RepID=A0ACB9ZP04_CATRO|nr:hypothetical protein M9H77_34778 [Catharanthus roseus]
MGPSSIPIYVIRSASTRRHSKRPHPLFIYTVARCILLVGRYEVVLYKFSPRLCLTFERKSEKPFGLLLARSRQSPLSQVGSRDLSPAAATAAGEFGGTD